MTEQVYPAGILENGGVKVESTFIPPFQVFPFAPQQSYSAYALEFAIGIQNSTREKIVYIHLENSF